MNISKDNNNFELIQNTPTDGQFNNSLFDKNNTKFTNNKSTIRPSVALGNQLLKHESNINHITKIESLKLYSENEWDELIQNLDLSILVVTQGDETTIDAPTIASVIFPAFTEAIQYDGLDQYSIDYIDNQQSCFENIRDKLLSKFKTMDHNVLKNNHMAVKRWMRDGASVRVDLKRDPITTYIVKSPIKVIIYTLMMFIFFSTLIFFPTKHPIIFDLSTEQFRVEGISATLQEDIFQQARLNSYQYFPIFEINSTEISSSKMETNTNNFYQIKYSNKLSRKILSNNENMVNNRYFTSYNIHLYFYSKWGINLLDEVGINFIREKEREVMQMPNYINYCIESSHKDELLFDKIDRPYPCRPINSFTNYAYTSINTTYYDYGNINIAKHFGVSKKVIDINFLKKYLRNDKLEGFFDKNFLDHGETTLIHSEFFFGLPLPGYDNPFDRRDEQNDVIKKEFIEPMIKHFNQQKDSYPGLGIYIDGDGVQEFILFEVVFGHDMYLLLGSFLCIIFFMVFHIRSLFLAITGIFGIIMSLGIWLFFYRVIFGIESLSLLSTLALFLILAIGTDDIFVFWDTWKYSAMLDLKASDIKNEIMEQNMIFDTTNKSEIMNLTLRMAWTLRSAGAAMLATTFTSAVAFFAIAISPITPVHNFGIFMGGLTIINYILVLTWFPACVIIQHLYLRKKYCRRRRRDFTSTRSTTGLDHHLIKQRLQLKGDRSTELGNYKQKRIWREINKRNTCCRDSMLRFHVILYRFRYILVLSVFIGVIFAFFTAITLRAADEVITLLPKDSNLEMVEHIKRNVLAICEDCDYPVSKAHAEQTPYPATKKRVPNFLWMKDDDLKADIDNIINTLPHSYTENKYKTLIEAHIAYPGVLFATRIKSQYISTDNMLLQWKLPNHIGISDIESFTAEIIPYPISDINSLNITLYQTHNMLYTFDDEEQIYYSTISGYDKLESNYPVHYVPWLKHNSKYLIRWAAKNADGWGNFTTPRLITTIDGTPNTKFANDISMNSSYDEWIITFEANNDNDTKFGEIISYELQLIWNINLDSQNYEYSQILSSDNFQINSFNQSIASFNNTVCNGINYQLSVAQSNRHATSNFTTYGNFNIPSSIPNDLIILSNNTGIPNNDIPLSINISTRLSCINDDQINQYEIYLKGPLEFKDDNWQLVSDIGSINNIQFLASEVVQRLNDTNNVSSLITDINIPVDYPSSYYEIKIRSKNSIGWSNYSDSIYSVSMNVKSLPPTMLSITSTITSITIIWDEPNVIDSQLDFYNNVNVNFTYKIELYSHNDYDDDYITIYSNITTYTINDLNSNENYDVKLYAFNGYDWSEPIFYCIPTSSTINICDEVDYPILCLNNWCSLPERCENIDNDRGPRTYQPEQDINLSFTFDTYSNIINFEYDPIISYLTHSYDTGYFNRKTKTITISNFGLDTLSISAIELFADDNNDNNISICGNIGIYFKDSLDNKSELFYDTMYMNIKWDILSCTSHTLFIVMKPSFNLKAGHYVCNLRLIYKSWDADNNIDTFTSSTINNDNIYHFKVSLDINDAIEINPIRNISISSNFKDDNEIVEVKFDIEDNNIDYDGYIIQYRESSSNKLWSSKLIDIDDIFQSATLYTKLSLPNIKDTHYDIRVTTRSQNDIANFEGYISTADCDHLISDNSNEILICSGNGFCTQSSLRREFKSSLEAYCYCQDGFEGLYCQANCPLRNIGDLPCSGNGKCINNQCQCNLGYNGQYCENICMSQCNNRGLCFLNENNDLKCACISGFTGSACQIECENDDCSNINDEIEYEYGYSSASSSSSSSTSSSTSTSSSSLSSSITSSLSTSSSSSTSSSTSSIITLSPTTKPNNPSEIKNLGDWELYDPSYEAATLPSWAYARIKLTYGLMDIKYDQNRFDGTYGTVTYDENFDLSDEAAQQFHYDLCNYLISLPYTDTNQQTKTCFFIHFRQYVLDADEFGIFPVPKDQFIDAIKSFFTRKRISIPIWKELISISDDGLYVTFFAVQAIASFDDSLAGQLIEPYYDIWQYEISMINQVAPLTTNNGFQNSEVWVRMHVEVEFVQGVITSYITSCSFIFIAIILFTRNLRMASLSVLVIICIVILMIAILVENGMKLGSIEAISIQIIVGLAIDYLLHLAHRYTHSPFFSQYGRARHALVEIGAPVLSAGITTMISSFMLLFAEVQILKVVGEIIFFMTLTSIILSTIFYIPLLMILGPVGRWYTNHKEKIQAKKAYKSINPVDNQDNQITKYGYIIKQHQEAAGETESAIEALKPKAKKKLIDFIPNNKFNQ